MDRRRSAARLLNLILLFLLPGAACGLLPLLTAARSGGADQAAAPRVQVTQPLSYSAADVVPLTAVDLPQVTATPFQPVANTPTLPPPSVPTVEVHHLIEQNTPLPTEEPTPEPVVSPYLWHGLDLSDGGPLVRLEIAAPEPVNRGQPLEIAFRVGRPCEYYDHRACLSVHDGGRLLLATVHSGVGGEGQSLRHALEGTGLNRAGYGLERIAQNVSALHGAPVRAQQDADASLTVDDLRVVAIGRVPASAVAAYFALPFDEALALAGIDLEEERTQARAGESALLVIETCGWRHNQENWAPGVTDTTGSVYLVVLGE